jgi:hypothetical protein
MMTDNQNKTVYYWFGVFAICFSCFQIISSYIRPNYIGQNIYIKYLLGVAPNFFPAIGIPALIIAIIMQNKKIEKESKLYKHQNIIAASISTTGLVIWEFIQSNSTRLVFDLNDILWTFIGSLLFIIIYKITN